MHGAQVITMALPFGQQHLYFEDLNIVALSPDLDAEGRERELDALQQEWRATLQRVATTAA